MAKPEWKSDYPVNDLIINRWSRRAFSEDPIPGEVRDSLFEAARWAPSSMNEQPWAFIYGEKGTEAWDQLFEALMGGNQPWAAKAPLLVLVLAKKRFDYKDRVNRHYMHDVGFAMGNLTVQATEHGLNMHQMGGFRADAVIETFQLPELWEPVTITAIGYPGDSEALEEPYLTRESNPRVRKQIADFAFDGNTKPVL